MGVLEEEIDKNYEPSVQEIEEYAKWLDMDVEQDRDLLWIAKAGLKAPLPPPWKPCQTEGGEEGDVFYFNFETGESVWDHPCDAYHKNLYKRERAKKYGEPFSEDDPLENSGTASEMASGSISKGLDSASGSMEDAKKKGKKEKKEKKE